LIRVSSSLVGHLIGAVNGASIARKTSFLKDRLGQQLFDKNIRIIDDPLRVRGMRRRRSIRRCCDKEARHHR
jgi:PmbA protein